MGARDLIVDSRRAAGRFLNTVGRSLSALGHRAAERWHAALERAPRPVQRTVRVAVGTVRDAMRDRVPRLASEVAFYALLALPPAALAVVGTIGYVFNLFGADVTRDVEDQIVRLARNFLTTSTINDVVRPTIRSVVRRGDAGVVWVGIAIALWSASRATAVVMEVIRIAHDVDDKRSGLRRRLVALGYTATLVLGLVIILPVLVVGPRVVRFMASPLGLGDAAVVVWEILYWPAVALLAVALLATFYFAVVPRAQSWWSEVPGAALAVVVWAVGGIALRVYARTAFDGSSVFGALSSPLVMLLWMYVTGLALLIGVELNSELEHGRASTEPER